MSSIVIAAPIRPTDRSGNDVTANRWAHHLSALGHDVAVVAVEESSAETTEPGAPGMAVPGGDFAGVEPADADLLIALHARRSAAAVHRWDQQRPGRPVILALTGTDLYLDLPDSAPAMANVTRADRLIVLQPSATDRLRSFDPALAAKAEVVHQSVDPAVTPERQPVSGEFRVIVLAHLRAVKDPLLAARASRRLPATSTVVVDHAGRALDRTWGETARREAEDNPRYRWHGELAGRAALELLATGDVLACTSVAEGGANAVTEAIAVGIPVIGTRIDGNTGLLGTDHPGLFPVGDDAALAQLLLRLEHDRAALSVLQRRTDRLKPLTDPATERRVLGAVVDSL